MAAGDIAAVIARAEGASPSPAFTTYTITASMNGTNAVETTIVVGAPIKAGSLFLAVTGGTDTNVITASLRPAAVPSAAFKTANTVFNGTTTIGAAGDGAATTAYKIFAFPTSGVTIAPGSYVFRLTANAAETGTVVATLHLQSTP